MKRVTSIDTDTQDELLLKKFNNRDSDAFGKIYNHYYKELYYYTSSLYANSGTDAKDVIQDLFMEIWQNKKLKFDSLKGIKSYAYVVIKNKFRMNYNHLKVIEKANRYMIDNEDGFIMNAAEAEIFSLIPTALNLLPAECAKSLKLFLEGWNIDEIAEHLGKKKSTIYNQKNDSLELLRKKYNPFFRERKREE